MCENQHSQPGSAKRASNTRCLVEDLLEGKTHPQLGEIFDMASTEPPSPANRVPPERNVPARVAVDGPRRTIGEDRNEGGVGGWKVEG